MDKKQIERLLDIPSIGEHSQRHVASMLKERAVLLQKCASLHDDLQSRWMRQLDRDQDWEYSESVRHTLRRVIQENGQMSRSLMSRLDAINAIATDLDWTPDLQVMARVGQVHNLRSHHKNIQRKLSRAMKDLSFFAERHEARNTSRSDQAARQRLTQAQELYNNAVSRVEHRKVLEQDVADKLNQACLCLQEELRRSELQRLQKLMSQITSHLTALKPDLSSYLDHMRTVTEDIEDLDIEQITKTWQEDHSRSLQFNSSNTEPGFARRLASKLHPRRKNAKKQSSKESDPGICDNEDALPTQDEISPNLTNSPPLETGRMRGIMGSSSSPKPSDWQEPNPRKNYHSKSSTVTSNIQ